MEKQYLYYAEMKIIIDSVELKERLEKVVKWKENEHERERTERKQRETKRNRQGCENNFHSLCVID